MITLKVSKIELIKQNVMTYFGQASGYRQLVAVITDILWKIKSNISGKV